MDFGQILEIPIWTHQRSVYVFGKMHTWQTNESSVQCVTCGCMTIAEHNVKANDIYWNSSCKWTLNYLPSAIVIVNVYWYAVATHKSTASKSNTSLFPWIDQNLKLPRLNIGREFFDSLLFQTRCIEHKLFWDRFDVPTVMRKPKCHYVVFSDLLSIHTSNIQ